MENKEEIVRHIMHIVDLKISLYDKMQNANRVMKYHDKIEAEHGGISMIKISQQEQFDKGLQEQIKLIEDDVKDLVTKL